MRELGTAVALLVLLTAVGVAGGQPLSPLIADWDQFFTIQPESARRDGRSVATIRNTSGWGASRIRLLVEGLDGNGQPVNQRVVWLGSDLPAGTHVHFEAPMPAAASYRVRVFAFDLELTGGPR